MNKKEICEILQNYINEADATVDLSIPENAGESEAFYYRTAIRLKNAVDLYRKDSCFKNDFLLALRDFLLVYESGLRINGVDISDDNDYAIKRNSTNGEYFCSFQFPGGVTDSFAESAFMRKISVERAGIYDYNLMTDSLIYRMTGYRYFKTMSQKLAFYGALNTPDGYTTLVSLPTGGGKSLITQMLAYQTDGLTIVVVPTVSLSDDQLIAAKQTIKSENIDDEVFAYRSGVEIAPILASIQKHTARLLFISPEALMNNSAFEDVMKMANKQHYLKNIIVDEAHIVVDWGASFRVDYQCLDAHQLSVENSFTLCNF